MAKLPRSPLRPTSSLPPNMSSSDKRRGGSSSSHNIRSSASSRSSVIAPLPRAQLGGNASSSSSPGPETDESGSTATTTANVSTSGSGGSNNKDGGGAATGAAARERESILLLKEKDDKIAELKRELLGLEAEFARQVDRLSQNESETASFWQSKHSSLNQQFLRTDTELRLLRAEIEVREGEREELKEGWEVLRQELKARDEEIRRLRADLMGLKKWLSANTRTDEQESDDLFGNDMTRLGNGLQEWVIKHFRRSKLGESAQHTSMGMGKSKDCKCKAQTHLFGDCSRGGSPSASPSRSTFHDH
jgi:activating signal cointegrator complex subunit 1